MAEKFFKIRLVFIWGFSKDSKILKVVEKHALKYLAPMEKNDRKRFPRWSESILPYAI